MKLQKFSQDTNVSFEGQITTTPTTIYSITIGPQNRLDLYDWAGPGAPPDTARVMAFIGSPANPMTMTFEFGKGLPVDGGVYISFRGGVLIVYET